MAAGFRDLFAAAGAAPGTDAITHIPGAISLAFGVTGWSDGAMAGASSMSFAPTGAMLGLGLMSSAPTATFTVTPDLGGNVAFFGYPGFWITGAGFPEAQALTSTIPITTTVSGGFTADGPLVSSVDLSFVVNGSQPPGIHSLLWGSGLGIGVDAGVMSGAVSFSFSGTGDFALSEGFFQNVAVTTSFTVTARFDAEAALQKYQGRFRSPLMHPGYGPWNPGLYKRRRNSVAAKALGEVTGTVPMTLSALGSMTGSVGDLVGDVTASFTVVGTPNDAGILQSSVPLLFTPVGALAGDGALVGDVQVATSFTATLTDPGTMTGASSMLFSVSGAAKGAGSMDSLIAMTLRTAGAFPSVWRPVYTGHGTVWRPIKTQ